MSRLHKTIIIICSTVALFLLILFLPSVNVLSISNRKNSSQRIYSTDAYDAGFCISYTHSVNKGRVHDYYQRNPENGNLIMTHTHFVSYGAGIPEPEETKGADFQVLENGYLLSNINRTMPELLVAVGTIAEHTFSACHYDAEKIGEPMDELLLKQYFRPQTSLVFKYKKVSLFEYLIHKI